VVAGYVTAKEWEVVEGGMEMAAWKRLWNSCHAWVMGCPVRIAWPDNGSTLEQPAIAVHLFELISVAMIKEAVKSRGK